MSVAYDLGISIRRQQESMVSAVRESPSYKGVLMTGLLIQSLAIALEFRVRECHHLGLSWWSTGRDFTICRIDVLITHVD